MKTQAYLKGVCELRLWLGVSQKQLPGKVSPQGEHTEDSITVVQGIPAIFSWPRNLTVSSTLYEFIIVGMIGAGLRSHSVLHQGSGEPLRETA